MEKMNTVQPLFSHLPERLAGLEELAENLFYYKTSESGVPQDWVKAMKAAMKSNTARFSARRMAKEYIEKFYSKGMR